MKDVNNLTLFMLTKPYAAYFGKKAASGLTAERNKGDL